jgi:hypothetical protein
MLIIAVAVGAIIVFLIAFKVLRMVMHGCIKLVILAILISICATAWFSLRHRIMYRYHMRR